MTKKNKFIPEPVYDNFADSISDLLINDIKKYSSKKRILTLEYYTPLDFTLSVLQRRVSEFIPSRIKEFKQLPWEKISFVKNGFALDSNAFLPLVSDLTYPEIEISICLNSDSSLIDYTELRYRLLDNIRHEFEHLLQKGVNSIKSHEVNTPISVRRTNETNFKYFLLSSEIPAMVAGLKLVSEKRGTSLEQESYSYLNPFIEYKMITKSEADHIVKTWLKFSMTNIQN